MIESYKGIYSLLLYAVLVGLFPFLIWVTYKNGILGVGAILVSLPVLSLIRRAFAEDSMPFPSLETLAVILVWVVDYWRYQKDKANEIKLPLSISLCIAIFIMACFLSSLNSHDPLLSLKITISGAIVPLLCLSIVYRNLIDVKQIDYLVIGTLLIAFQVVVYTALNLDRRMIFAAGIQNVSGYFYNEAAILNLFVVPSTTAATLMFAPPMAAWYKLKGGKYANYLLPFVLLGVSIATILSLSRGSWFAGFVSVMGSLLMVMKKHLLKMAAIASVLILLLLLSGVFDILGEVLVYRLQGPASGTGHVSLRSANYILTLESIPSNILVGGGLGQYDVIYDDYPLHDASWMPHLWFAHSLFLTLIPEIGFVGALAFFGIFLATIIRAIRFLKSIHSKQLRIFIIASLIGLTSFFLLANSSGIHLIGHLFRASSGYTYFSSPVLIVVFTFLGSLIALLKIKTVDQQSIKTNIKNI